MQWVYVRDYDNNDIFIQYVFVIKVCIELTLDLNQYNVFMY